MNRYQKLAWLNLIVIAAFFIVITAVITIELQMRGYSIYGLWCVGILALLKFKPFMFKKPQGQDKVVCDERDTLIVKRARSFAYTTFWWVFIAFSFGVHIFMGMGPKSSVPTITLPLMAVGGTLFIQIICSVAILVQYGRGGKGEKS